MTAPDLSDVVQTEQPDVRGVLALNNLPPEYQRAEDATAMADRERARTRNPRGHEREATPTERILTEVNEPVPEPNFVGNSPQSSELDDETVVEAAKRLAAQRPHLAKPTADRPPSDRPIERLRPGASPETKPKPISPGRGDTRPLRIE